MVTESRNLISCILFFGYGCHSALVADNYAVDNRGREFAILFSSNFKGYSLRKLACDVQPDRAHYPPLVPYCGSVFHRKRYAATAKVNSMSTQNAPSPHGSCGSGPWSDE